MYPPPPSLSLCIHAGQRWAPTSGRSRLVEHGTISSTGFFFFLLQQRCDVSNSAAQSIPCPVVGRDGRTDDDDDTCPCHPRKKRKKGNRAARRDLRDAPPDAVQCEKKKKKKKEKKDLFLEDKRTEGKWEERIRIWKAKCSGERLTCTSQPVLWVWHRASGEARVIGWLCRGIPVVSIHSSKKNIFLTQRHQIG